jgi:hypothetical protein
LFLNPLVTGQKTKHISLRPAGPLIGGQEVTAALAVEQQGACAVALQERRGLFAARGDDLREGVGQERRRGLDGDAELVVARLCRIAFSLAADCFSVHFSQRMKKCAPVGRG